MTLKQDSEPTNNKGNIGSFLKGDACLTLRYDMMVILFSKQGKKLLSDKLF